ncbi:MAG: ATP-binding cassette domain-containing protein [Clostridia bacterium]|nr:ATP-binding cassette domain-containing protein [Clostridia bacterium]
MNEIILKTNNLTKKYKEFIALDNVNLSISKGDIYGLIGRNGAGKTTLMKIITTLSNKTSGEFELFGKKDNNLTETKRRIGCLIENPAFFPNLSAVNNLRYYAIQKGIVDKKQIDEVIDLVGLSEAKNKKFKTYSLGMKQRLGIAFAILDNPDFIILDEPINGLDPIGISELRDLFKKLNLERNITILISSHILNELYQVSNKFCIIEKGKIIKEITKEQLDEECSKCIVIKTKEASKVAVILEEQLKTKNYKIIDDTEIRLYDYLENSSKVNKTLIKNDIDIISLYETGITLEDYFKTIIKEGK